MAFSRFVPVSSLLLASALLTGVVQAQGHAPVAVEGAWARASVPGQMASGAFMRLTSPEATRLVRAESPVAGVVEVHEMKMEGDIMKMRALPGLDLPAGQAVELKPGGYHVMLMDLKAPLAKGAWRPGQPGRAQRASTQALSRAAPSISHGWVASPSGKLCTSFFTPRMEQP